MNVATYELDDTGDTVDLSAYDNTVMTFGNTRDPRPPTCFIAICTPEHRVWGLMLDSEPPEFYGFPGFYELRYPLDTDIAPGMLIADIKTPPL